MGLLSGSDLWIRNSTVVVGCGSIGWKPLSEYDKAKVQAPHLHGISLSACSGWSTKTHHSPSLLPSFPGHSMPSTWDGIPFDSHSTFGLQFQISCPPPSMTSFLPQSRTTAHHQRVLTHYQNIIRIEEKMSVIEVPYFLSQASESGVCSSAWTNSRQMEISSVACFRYARPISFIYLTNENLSNLWLRLGGRHWW